MTTATLSGPYVSVDYDELYLPVTDRTYNAARTEAAEWAQDFIDTWGRSRYTGKRMVPVHDHEDWEYCETCPSVSCWCFDIYEGTPRWTE